MDVGVAVVAIEKVLRGLVLLEPEREYIGAGVTTWAEPGRRGMRPLRRILHLVTGQNDEYATGIMRS